MTRRPDGPSCWAVIPAGGAGRRMNAAIPKQYLPLRGKPVISYPLELFCAHPRISGVVVALAADDPYWPTLEVECHGKPVVTAPGGEERCHSVLNALNQLQSLAGPDDWVLVHDAARPCLRRSDLDKLIGAVTDHPVGGLLGVPVRDTIKRVDSRDRVYETVDRASLWHALTPQMFRLQPLRSALLRALDEGVLVTDEAGAIELSGARPIIVEGSADNIKITHPEDLARAAFNLAQAHQLPADEAAQFDELDGLTADEG